MNLLTLIIFLLLFTVSGLPAQSVRVSWDPVTTVIGGETIQNLLGYRVFFGSASRIYSDSIFVSKESLNISLVPFFRYFFSVKAYNNIGGSGFSSEVPFTVLYTARPSKANIELEGFLEEFLLSGLTRYSFFEVTTGEEYYDNRDYVLTDIPSFLEGAVSIQTSNGDSDKKATDPNWIQFDANRDVDVFVFYNKVLLPPDWLGVDTGFRASTTDSGVGFFKIYKSFFKAGLIVLGGNESPSTESNYFVAILPSFL